MLSPGGNEVGTSHPVRRVTIGFFHLPPWVTIDALCSISLNGPKLLSLQLCRKINRTNYCIPGHYFAYGYCYCCLELHF